MPKPSGESRTRVRRLVAIAATGLALLVPFALRPSAEAATVTITNGVQFTDMAGAAVRAHGGGMIKVDQYYYWFGENRNDNNTFRAVSVYRSTDLRSWEFRRNILTQSSAAELNVSNIERPKIIYNSSTGQYVLWMHWENGSDYGQARVAVATSSTVDGNYSYRGSFRPLGFDSRDMTVYRDDDGSAYLISSTRVNADLNIYRLTADYTGVASRIHTLWPGSYREAPAMFKRNGVYFLVTSGATGWQPNQAKYATASSIAGSWSGLSNFGNSITYGSQSAYVVPVQGSSTTSYLYLGDRWAGAWGARVTDSRYVWLPLTFPSNTSLSMSWYPRVNVDTATGVVSGSGSGFAYEYLKPRHSGKCLDVPSQSTADNVEIAQYGCNSGANQQWQALDLGTGYHQLIARHSGKCLTVPSSSTADGTRVVQQPCGAANNNQQWQIADLGGGYHRFTARHSGKCLDVVSGSTADGARITQYACNSGTNQQWQRVGAP